jgi:glucose dehydrogenase
MKIAAPLALLAVFAATEAPLAAARAQIVEWPTFGGDLASTKFSKLIDIDRSNVARLTKVWEWETGETPKPEFRTRPGNFQATPLMLGDTLFLSTS